jgi:hypothetical protein
LKFNQIAAELFHRIRPSTYYFRNQSNKSALALAHHYFNAGTKDHRSCPPNFDPETAFRTRDRDKSTDFSNESRISLLSRQCIYRGIKPFTVTPNGPFCSRQCERSGAAGCRHAELPSAALTSAEPKDAIRAAIRSAASSSEGFENSEFRCGSTSDGLTAFFNLHEGFAESEESRPRVVLARDSACLRTVARVVCLRAWKGINTRGFTRHLCKRLHT